MKNLYEILENINIESSDKVRYDDFVSMLEEQMPGYKIDMWDMDEFGNDLTSSVAEYIIDEALDGATDIQYEEWHTDNEDAYYAFVASKTEDSKDKIIKNLTDEVFDLKQTINKLSNQMIELLSAKGK